MSAGNREGETESGTTAPIRERDELGLSNPLLPFPDSGRILYEPARPGALRPPLTANATFPQIGMPAALAIALGGACGALARYGAGRLVALFVEHPFPWGTWLVNLVGCFLIGMTVPLFGQLSAADSARFFLVVGFLGSFTTFSTFSLDTLALWGNGHGLWALFNAVGSLACGLVLVAGGRAICAWLLGLY